MSAHVVEDEADVASAALPSILTAAEVVAVCAKSAVSYDSIGTTMLSPTGDEEDMATLPAHIEVYSLQHYYCCQ